MAYSVRENQPIITVWRSKTMQFVGVPKELLSCASNFGLAIDDVLLYCVLRSRSDYSMQNKWYDDQGRVYVIFTRQQAEEYLGLSHARTVEAFKRLSAAGLIEETEVSSNKMQKLKKTYVKQWVTPSELSSDSPFSSSDISAGKLPYVTSACIGNYVENFYMIPRLLLEHPVYSGLSLKARLLYSIALDSLHKSIMYGNVDANGLPFCSLKKEDMMARLQCSDRTLTSLYKELLDLGLMEKEKFGFSSEYRIYLRDYVPFDEMAGEGGLDCASKPSVLTSPQNLNIESAKFEHRDSKIYTSSPQNLNIESAAFEHQDRNIHTSTSQKLNTEAANNKPSSPQNLNTSDTSSQTSGSKTFSSVRLASDSLVGSSSEASQEERFASVDLPKMIHQLAGDLQLQYASSRGDWDRAKYLVQLTETYIREDILSSQSYIRFGNETYPASVVRAEYFKLTPEIIQTLITKIVERWDVVRKVPDYLHKSLVTAAGDHEGESFYVGKENEARKRTAQF